MLSYRFIHFLGYSPSRHLFAPSIGRFSRPFASSRDNVTIADLGKGVKLVQLNRPEKLNSLNMKMFESITHITNQLRNDESVRVVILSGAGKAFCTGLDISSILSPLEGNPKTNLERLLTRPHTSSNNGGMSTPTAKDETSKSSPIPTNLGNLAQNAAYLWREIPAPVIAVLHGMCYGGGLQIALGADLRLAEPNCKLSVMEAKWGLIPDMAGSITLRELVRIDIAKELTMTGRVITGEEGAKLGLITRCHEDPMGEAVKVANEIVSRSPDAVALTKRLFQETWVTNQADCLELETKLQKKLIGSWNQLASSAKNFSLNVPYVKT